MSLSTIFSAAVVGILASTASAATFKPDSKNNVAVYWGQGYAQGPLSDVCADPNVDIVNIGFVTQFPKVVGDYPVTNFGKFCNACLCTTPLTLPQEMLAGVTMTCLTALTVPATY
jgi:chitinase